MNKLNILLISLTFLLLIVSIMLVIQYNEFVIKSDCFIIVDFDSNNSNGILNKASILERIINLNNNGDLILNTTCGYK